MSILKQKRRVYDILRYSTYSSYCVPLLLSIFVYVELLFVNLKMPPFFSMQLLIERLEQCISMSLLPVKTRGKENSYSYL